MAVAAAPSLHDVSPYSSALQYDIPPAEFSRKYGESRLFLREARISTQLPGSVVAIRIVATVAFTALLATQLTATLFCWPVVALGVGFAGWTGYAHLLSQDPLIKTFHRIVGGEEKFKQLHTILLNQAPTETLYAALTRLEWNELPSPICKTTTLDGRQIVIVKGWKKADSVYYRSVLAFAEKARPVDISTKLPLLVANIYCAIFGSLYIKTVESLPKSTSSRESMHVQIHNISSNMTTTMANEFFAQLATRSPSDHR